MELLDMRRKADLHGRPWAPTMLLRHEETGDVTDKLLWTTGHDEVCPIDVSCLHTGDQQMG